MSIWSKTLFSGRLFSYLKDLEKFECINYKIEKDNLFCLLRMRINSMTFVIFPQDCFMFKYLLTKGNISFNCVDGHLVIGNSYGKLKVFPFEPHRS